MTETGFRDPTQQSHASHDPCPALRQWCNLKTDGRQQGEQSSAERWLKKGPQGCPINASEHKKSLRRAQELPYTYLRSQKPGRAPPKEPKEPQAQSTAAPSTPASPTSPRDEPRNCPTRTKEPQEPRARHYHDGHGQLLGDESGTAEEVSEAARPAITEIPGSLRYDRASWYDEPGARLAPGPHALNGKHG